MKRKIIIWCVFVVLSIWMLILIIKPRSYKKMERLAESGLNREISQVRMNKTAKDFHKMPVKESKDKRALIFQWFYFLELGDTVIVNIEVKKQVYPWECCEGIDYNTNQESRYINLDGPNNFSNLLPNNYQYDSLYLSSCTLYQDNDKFLKKNDTIKPFVSSVKLFAYLKNGYFDLVQKFDDHTFISFYQYIAEFNDGKSKYKIKTADIYFNHKGEVLIIPSNKPHE